MAPLSRAQTRRASRVLAPLVALAVSMPVALASPAVGQPPTKSTAEAAQGSPGSVMSTGSAGTDATCSIGPKLVPTCGAYLGVAANPIGGESYDQAFRNWETKAGRTADIAHFYMRGESVMFPTPTQIGYATEPGRERLLLLNWRPSKTWRDVANGADDTYLKNLASYIKTNFDQPFMMTLHAEMEAEVNSTPGSGMTAIDFRDFFRHTVTVLRANGADKIVFVLDYIGAPNWGDVPWFKDLYPGDEYVDWLAEDPFSFGKPPVWLSEFPGMVNRVQNPPGSTWKGWYSWSQANHPEKPVMLAEWGVDESDAYPSFKANFFNQLVKQMARFPNIHALVYWDDPGAPTVGETRIDSSPQSLQAFKTMVQSDELTRAGRRLLHRRP